MLKKGNTVYTAFSEYVIEKQINQGGNGTVFLVRDQNNGKYALKAIDRNRTTSDKLKRFKNEIAFCERTDDPHIIKVLDYGAYKSEQDDIIFYIMPVYEMTLRQKMEEGIAPEQALQLFIQVIKGLDTAHQKSVWHRDIKPENILIDGEGKAVIADFGIARFSENEIATVVETKKSERLANFQYAAPEQRERNRLVDGRADIYAVGMILNEMFTHNLPIGVGFTKIGDVAPSYAYLDPVVEKMLQQDPEKRLYPAAKVITCILVAQKDEEKSKELLQLTTGESKQESPNQIVTPSIRYADYRDGCLVLYLDGIGREWAGEWFKFVQNGSYMVHEVMGYGRSQLSFLAPDKLQMRIPASDDQLIERVVDNIKSWITGGTVEYNKELNARHIRRINEEREKRIQEIKRLQEEEKMRTRLTAMFQ